MRLGVKTEYRETIDESVDAHVRLGERASAVRALKWQGLILSGFLVVIVLLIPNPWIGKIIVGGLAAGLFFTNHRLTYKWRYRRRIRRAIVKALGTTQPVSCEYEIDESGIAFRRLGQEIRFSWSVVQDVVYTDRYIEIGFAPTGVTLIPKSIFDGTELAEWTEFIETHRPPAPRAHAEVVPGVTSGGPHKAGVTLDIKRRVE